MVELFRDEGKFDEASSHLEQAKSYIANDAYQLGFATEFQANVWYLQLRLEEAKAEILRAIESYEKLGAAKDVRGCRDFLQVVEQAMNSRSTNFRGGLLETMARPTSVNFCFLA